MSEIVDTKPSTKEDNRLRLALDSMPVAAIWSCPSDGRIEFMNRSFVEMFGYQEGDVPNVYELIDAVFLDRDQAGRATQALRAFADGKADKRADFPNIEVLAKKRDGSLIITSFSGVVLPSEDMSLATFVDMTVIKQQEQVMKRLAEEDPLTGLANRRSFDRILETTVDGGDSRFSLLMLDLDDFKAVNDISGHDAGDQVLQHFARTMKACFRNGDIMARWGGDEFVVLLMPPASERDIAGVVKRLSDALKDPIVIAGRPHRIGVSAGWATYPDNADHITQLYKVADEAMYKAKRSARNKQAAKS